MLKYFSVTPTMNYHKLVAEKVFQLLLQLRSRRPFKSNMSSRLVCAAMFRFGCCADGESEARGPLEEGCPGVLPTPPPVEPRGENATAVNCSQTE